MILFPSSFPIPKILRVSNCRWFSISFDLGVSRTVSYRSPGTTSTSHSRSAVRARRPVRMGVCCFSVTFQIIQVVRGVHQGKLRQLQGLTVCTGPDVRVCRPLLLYSLLKSSLIFLSRPHFWFPKGHPGSSYLSRSVSVSFPVTGGSSPLPEEREFVSFPLTFFFSWTWW
jgi:hypothetical protein